jgi:hypothetical protein
MIDDLELFGPAKRGASAIPIAERDDMAVLDRQQAVVMVQDRGDAGPAVAGS